MPVLKVARITQGRELLRIKLALIIVMIIFPTLNSIIFLSKKMQSAEKLLGYVNESMALISGGAEGDAGSLVSRALGLMRKASGLDEGAEKMAEALANVEDMLGDFSLEASRYAESLEFSEEDFVKTEERLNIINSLKLKFGSTIQKILDYYEEKSPISTRMLCSSGPRLE